MRFEWLRRLVPLRASHSVVAVSAFSTALSICWTPVFIPRQRTRYRSTDVARAQHTGACACTKFPKPPKQVPGVPYANACTCTTPAPAPDLRAS